jgi:predicted TIM-barrel fold metal-dependent hydrolase
MIVDGHCHGGKGDGLSDPWNTDAPLDLYLRRAQRAGIDRTVVFPAFHSDYAKANAQLARIIGHYPDRFVGFAFVHCGRDAGRIRAMVERAVREWNFRGIKVHYSDAPLSREVCETARRLHIPILVDIGGNTPPVDMFASQYPDVSFIIPHLGSFNDDWRAQQQVVDQLVRWPNVYADSSGVRRFDYLVQAVRRAGPTKLLFGSDGPWLHPEVELRKIKLLALPKAKEELVLGLNMLRLLGESLTIPR